MTDDDLMRLLTTAVKRINVASCRRLTDASIVAVAENCAKLTKLDASRCSRLTDGSIGAVAEKCPKLTDLRIPSCALTALPENIGKLSNLREFAADYNHLEVLPRSIVDLGAACNLRVGNNPLQTPPLAIAQQGIPAIRRHFEELDDDSS